MTLRIMEGNGGTNEMPGDAGADDVAIARYSSHGVD